MSTTIRPVEEAKKALYQKQAELSEFVKANTDENGNYTFPGDGIKALNDRNDELNKIAEEVEQAQKIADAVKSAGDGMREASQTRRKYPFASGNEIKSEDFGHEMKGLGDYFVESEAYKSTSHGSGRAIEYAVDAPVSAIKAVTLASALPYPTQRAEVVGFATRRPIVADLIPQSDSDQPAIVYLEQTTQTFGADTVAEGALKPGSDFAYTRRTVNFEVIAHWVKITNQALEDVPSLRDRLNEQMTIGLQLAEEDQLLTGTGTSPDLQGFLTKTGVQVVAKGADDVFSGFLASLTAVRFTGYANPTGAIFHPNDWQGILTTKDTTGRFIFGDPAMIQQSQRLWGIPFVVTNAMTENTCLIGDFQMYSRLHRKGGIRVLVGTEGDDLKRNMQTMVVEERVALEISRASAFVRYTGI